MILFVFEGKRREPDIFKTLEYLFFPPGQTIICSFGNNIYELYRQLIELGDSGDIVSLLRELNRNNPDSPFSEAYKTSDFSEIYLFFDYDFQNINLTIEQMNSQLSEMLEMFSDETNNGKLYINYPMLEAIRYTKLLPDENFTDYSVSRTECRDKGFKALSQRFSDYGSLDFVVLDFRHSPSDKEASKVKSNWIMLEEQNVIKAHYLCTGEKSVPVDKGSISQNKVFLAQLSQFVNTKAEVSILCAFPIFLFDYFK